MKAEIHFLGFCEYRNLGVPSVASVRLTHDQARQGTSLLFGFNLEGLLLHPHTAACLQNCLSSRGNIPSPHFVHLIMLFIYLFSMISFIVWVMLSSADSNVYILSLVPLEVKTYLMENTM